MRVGDHEQIVEFATIDRNHDGVISSSEMEAYRKMKGGGTSLGASSIRAELPSLSEAPQGSTSPRPQLEAPPGAGSAFHENLLPAAGPSPLADGSTLDLAPVGSYMLAHGLPIRDTSVLRPMRRHTPDAHDLVGSAVAEASEASTVLKLDPGLPYLLSVHTAKPAELCDYSIAIYADSLVDLSLIEPQTQRVLRGSWKSPSAGGSHIEGGRWTHNPQYALMISGPAHVEISLERPANKWDRLLKMHTMSALLGMYVLRGEESGKPLRSPSAAMASIIHQSTFMPGHEVKASLYLEPLSNGAPYILMPATFGEGMRGPFSIGVLADGVPLDIVALEDGSAPLRDAHLPL